MRTEEVRIRMHPEEKALWKTHADELGLTMSQYVRGSIEYTYFGGIEKEITKPVGFWRRLWRKML